MTHTAPNNRFGKAFTALLTPLVATVLMGSSLSAHALDYTDTMVAVVNETPILQSELNQALSQYKKSQITITKDQALSALISRELQLAVAKKAGVKPTDKEINRQLLGHAKSLGLPSISSLQQTLDAQQAYSFAQLRQDIIDDLSITLLKNRQVASKVNLTDQEVDAYLASPEGVMLNQNEYQTVHIRVPFPTGVNKVTKAQRDAAMDTAKKIATDLRYTTNNSNKSVAYIISKNQVGYPVTIKGGNMGFNKANSLPANLASKITTLSVNQVSSPITTQKGIDIIKLADKRVAENMIIPQWRTRHILVAVDNSQSSSNQAGKHKIDGLYKQLQDGADFAKLAATFSQDPGSAGKGGDLGWVNEGTMVDEFEKVMKTTPVESISQPFRSQFGWHIVQVVKTRNYDASSDVRQNMAREILFKRMAPQATKDWLDELRSNAYVRVF